MNKASLRTSMAAKRAELSRSEVIDLSSAVGSSLIDNFDFESVVYLHRFVPIESSNEVDTTLILKRILSAYSHIRTVAPVVEQSTRELKHIEVHTDTGFIKNKWGIPEPSDGESVDEKLIDLVLVPLICFDRRGHRVGYGGGYYDRFLAKCRPDCLKVGLSLFGPVDEIQDTHDGDVPLDYCVTPKKVFSFR